MMRVGGSKDNKLNVISFHSEGRSTAGNVELELPDRRKVADKATRKRGKVDG